MAKTEKLSEELRILETKKRGIKARFFGKVAPEIEKYIKDYNDTVATPISEEGMKQKGQVGGKFNSLLQTMGFFRKLFYVQLKNIEQGGILRITHEYIGACMERSRSASVLLVKNMLLSGILTSKSVAVKDFGNGRTNCLYLVFSEWFTALFNLLRTKLEAIDRRIQEIESLIAKEARNRAKEQAESFYDPEKPMKRIVDNFFKANNISRKNFQKNPFDSLE